MDERSDEILEKMDTLVGGSAVSLFGMIVKNVTEALMTLVLTTGIGAASYGIVASIRRVVLFLSSSPAGIYSSLKRTVPRHEEQTQNLIITFSYILMVIVSVSLACMMLLFRSEITSYTVVKEEDIQVVAFGGLMLVGLIQVSMTGAVFKSFKQIKNLVIVQMIIPSLLALISVVTALLIFDRTITNVVMAISLSYVTAAIICFLFMYRKTSYSILNTKFDSESLTEYITFLLPNTATHFIVIIQLFSFSVFMAVFLKPTEAGAFGVALALSPFVRWPLKAVNNIFPPVATELYNNDKNSILDQLYKRTTRMILTASLPILCVFILFYREIITLFTSEYLVFAVILPLMALGQLIAGAHGSVGLLLAMTDNEKKAMVLQIIVTPFLLLTTYLLTVNYGVIGLASSNLIAFSINNILEVSLLRYAEGLFPFTKSHLKPIGLAIVLTIGSFIIYSIIGFYASTVFFVISSVFYYTISFFYVFDSLDRKIILKYKP